MLKPDQSLAIYMNGALGSDEGKMGHGVLRYSPNPIVCVIDASQAGRRVPELTGIPRDVPVVADIDAACGLGATVLVLGIAPLGGRIPDAWRGDIDAAVATGMSIVNGLHQHLAPNYPALAPEQWVWDIRREPTPPHNATGAAARLPNRRVLLVGTDMNCGKMTAALELDRLARDQGLHSAFLATGQIGITISGRGVALDAVRLDFAAGAVEQMVLDAAETEIVFVEGQGSLLHPASSASLPLIRGACPTHLVLCARGGDRSIRHCPGLQAPDLDTVVRLYEDLAAAGGVFPCPRTAGINLNTGQRSESQACEDIAAAERTTGLPATDVIRFGADKLLEAILR